MAQSQGGQAVSAAFAMVVVVLIIHEWMLFQFEIDLEQVKEAKP